MAVLDAVVDHLQGEVHRFLVPGIVILGDVVAGDGAQRAQRHLRFRVACLHAQDIQHLAVVIDDDVATDQLTGEDFAAIHGTGQGGVEVDAPG